MEQSQNDNPSPKRKLSKEELLAGKCDPNENSQNDPRQKDPDELLLKLLAQKKGSAATPKVHAATGTPPESSLPEVVPQEEVKAPRVTVVPERNLNDIQNKKWLALKEMYDRDMTRWKEYEQNVTHWRDKVLQIVQRLQNELASAKGLRDEVDALKSVIKAKDEELAKMKKAMTRFLQNNNIDI